MVKEIDKFKKEMYERNRKKKKGFTLVELLAVFIILAIIASIVIVSLDNIKDKVTENVYKESIKNAINAAQNYYSENGASTNLKSGISIFSKDLNIENSKQYKSGSIIYNDSTGKLEAKNISNGSYCANGPIDNLTIVEGVCPSTELACFDYTVSSGKAAITGYDYDNPSCYGDVVVPPEIEGSPVTKIGFGAFADIDNSQSSVCNFHPPVGYFYDNDGSNTNALLSNTYNKSSKLSLLSNSYSNPEELVIVSEVDFMNYCIPYTTYYQYDDSGCECGIDFDLNFSYVGDRGYNITSVTLPSTVTYIDNLAFAKTGITGLNFDSLSDLTYIGDTSFIYTNLSSINLSGLSKLQTIGFYAFAMSGLENVGLTDISSLREIRTGAFYNNQISSVNFTGSNNILHIGTVAFNDNQINNIIINNLRNVYSIGSDAFCDNPFYYNNNYPSVTGMTNISYYQLDNACLLEGGADT